MEYICEECETPCRIDAGSKPRTYPVLCPWPGVNKESNWVPMRYASKPENSVDLALGLVEATQKEQVKTGEHVVCDNLKKFGPWS